MFKMKRYNKYQDKDYMKANCPCVNCNHSKPAKPSMYNRCDVTGQTVPAYGIGLVGAHFTPKTGECELKDAPAKYNIISDWLTCKQPTTEYEAIATLQDGKKIKVYN
jgi:hypothetical protein